MRMAFQLLISILHCYDAAVAMMPKFLHLVVQLEVSQAPIGSFVVVVAFCGIQFVFHAPMIFGPIVVHEARMIETFARFNLFVAHTFYFKNL